MQNSGGFPARGRPTVATIDLGAIRDNHGFVRRRAGGAEVIALVKADAYGHGAVPVARALAEAGCRRFAVVSVAEAVELRDAGLQEELLVLGGVHDAGEAAEAAARGATPVIHHAGHVALLAEAARVRAGAIPVQVEVDTGMRRMGVPEREAADLLERVAREPGLALEAAYTHFARADEEDLEPTREQLERFGAVLAEARRRGVKPASIHVANSAGLLAGDALGGPPPDTDAVRVGLLLYGARPGPHRAAEVRPAMTLRTRVAAVRTIGRGDAVGYGATWKAKRRTRIATLPIGYGDGVLCSTGNRGEVLLGGRRVPVVGRISMDFVTVDVGDGPVTVGDEAILFGEGEGGRLPVEEAAEAASSIAYELLVRVGARVPRVYVG